MPDGGRIVYLCRALAELTGPSWSKLPAVLDQTHKPRIIMVKIIFESRFYLAKLGCKGQQLCQEHTINTLTSVIQKLNHCKSNNQNCRRQLDVRLHAKRSYMDVAYARGQHARVTMHTYSEVRKHNFTFCHFVWILLRLILAVLHFRNLLHAFG